MRNPVKGESVQYNDNRVSLHAGQNGKCAVTGVELNVRDCTCYRKSEKTAQKRDSYQNLLLLSPDGLEFVSSSNQEVLTKLARKYELSKTQTDKVNRLRAMAGRTVMELW